MNKRAELSTLKEFAKIVEDPGRRASTYKRVWLVLVALGGVSTAASYVLAESGYFSAALAVGGGVVGGVLVGLAIYYSLAWQQVPLFAKYFNPNMEAMQNRIRELEKG